MNVLLDSHCLLWWLADMAMSDDASDMISDPSNEVFVSAASIWELEIKAALGKLVVDADLITEVPEAGFRGCRSRHSTVERRHDYPDISAIHSIECSLLERRSNSAPSSAATVSSIPTPSHSSRPNSPDARSPAAMARAAR
jgi:hypothetical protein